MSKVSNNTTQILKTMLNQKIKLNIGGNVLGSKITPKQKGQIAWLQF